MRPDAARLRRLLRTPGLAVETAERLPSTNGLLLERAAGGAPEGLVLLAGAQTAGRGRQGRAFFSPEGTGLYLSVLLRPACAPEEALLVTPCAAVAAAEAAEAAAGRAVAIKWVNDLYLDGRKVCGILAEAVPGAVVLGLGLNLAPPAGGFPPELAARAGALFPAAAPPDARERLAAAFLDSFFGYYPRLADRGFLAGYRRRLLRGPVRCLRPDGREEPGEALDVDGDFRLLLRGADGRVARLESGELRLAWPE